MGLFWGILSCSTDLCFYFWPVTYSSTLATSCEELTHWERLWCCEGLGARAEGDDRGWDGWMASLTRWTWVSVNARSWWWTGRPGVLRFMGSQRVRHDWVTDLNLIWKAILLKWNFTYWLLKISVLFPHLAPDICAARQETSLLWELWPDFKKVLKILLLGVLQVHGSAQ